MTLGEMYPLINVSRETFFTRPYPNGVSLHVLTLPGPDTRTRYGLSLLYLSDIHNVKEFFF